jgi:hypothetical protein
MPISSHIFLHPMLPGGHPGGDSAPGGNHQHEEANHGVLLPGMELLIAGLPASRKDLSNLPMRGPDMTE